MASKNNTEISKIVSGLDTKAALKQDVYGKTLSVFQLFRKVAIDIHKSIAKDI